MSKINPMVGPRIDTAGLGKFIPEPRSRLALDFGALMRGIGAIAGRAVSGLGGIDPGYMELINKQIETQQQLQLVSMESNIEKSKHETQMAAIRNIRVG